MRAAAWRDFRARHLPAGAASAHDLLHGVLWFGFQEKIAFAPSETDLASCIRDYERLLWAIDPSRAVALTERSMCEASELAAACVLRAARPRAGSAAWIAERNLLRTIDALFRSLKQDAGSHQRIAWEGHDGIKRLRTLQHRLNDRLKGRPPRTSPAVTWVQDVDVLVDFYTRFFNFAVAGQDTGARRRRWAHLRHARAERRFVDLGLNPRLEEAERLRRSAPDFSWSLPIGDAAYVTRLHGRLLSQGIDAGELARNPLGGVSFTVDDPAGVELIVSSVQ